MRRFLRGTRGRLTVVSTALLAVALLIAGVGVIGALVYAQRSDIDALLAAQADVVAAGIEETNGTYSFGNGETMVETPGGVAIETAIVGPGGPLVQSPSQPIATGTLMEIASAARTGGRIWVDTTDERGALRRAVAEPIGSTGAATVLILSRSVGELNAAVGRTALLLAAVSVALVVIGGALAYWLAGRALRPVRQIASLARTFGGHDLHRRVTIPVPDDELGELVDTFNEMLGRLEASFESLRRFTADASHELRAPLALLRNELDVTLAHERSGPEYRRTLEGLRGEVDHLGRLADQLLVLARADAGALVPQREPVDLTDLLHETAARWSDAAAARAVRIDIVAEGAGTVAAEPALFRRIIDNLVENALRYAPAGTAVTLSAGRDPGVRWVEVRDHGPGIASEHRPALFTRFARPDAARTREQGGAGLGLALSAAIATAHGGRIELLPGDGGPGACFRVFIPEAAMGAASASVPARGAGDRRNGRAVYPGYRSAHETDIDAPPEGARRARGPGPGTDGVHPRQSERRRPPTR